MYLLLLCLILLGVTTHNVVGQNSSNVKVPDVSQIKATTSIGYDGTITPTLHSTWMTTTGLDNDSQNSIDEQPLMASPPPLTNLSDDKTANSSATTESSILISSSDSTSDHVSSSILPSQTVASIESPSPIPDSNTTDDTTFESFTFFVDLSSSSLPDMHSAEPSSFHISSIMPSPSSVSTSSSSSIQPTLSSTTGSTPTPQSITPTNAPTTHTNAPSTTPPPPPSVKISETNILLVNERDNMFIELSGLKNGNLEGVYLTIRNAKEKDDKAGLLQVLKLAGSLDPQGLLVIDKAHLLNLTDENFSSVVIALYSDESQARKVTNASRLHSFVVSQDPNGVDDEVAEVYQHDGVGVVYVNTSMLDIIKSDLSMSSCNVSGFVLTAMSKSQPNNCDLSSMHSFKMKLTLNVGKKECPASHLPSLFENMLTKEIVSKVNEHRQCGLTSINVEDMHSDSRCDKENKVVGVDFNVKSAFTEQIACIKTGYNSFTGQKGSIVLDNTAYSVSDCSVQCFPNALPASESDDNNNIKVTVAVVVTCIGIFLVILLAVIVYMKRKKRGLLQFRMTRLDEDDDDLVGDMDDFVGNQGATFSNFR